MGIIDLFIQRDQAPQNNESAQQASQQPEYVSPTGVSKAVESTLNMTDSNIVSKIWDTIIDKNLPGPDYLELKSSAAALESMGLSESQRYEAAFKMLKQTYQNLTRDVIVSSIDNYVAIVEQEKTDGINECLRIKEQRVGGKVAEIKRLNDSQAEIRQQMENLQKQLSDSIDAARQLEVEVSRETAELNNQEKAFRDSIATVVKQLNEDKARISKLNL